MATTTSTPAISTTSVEAPIPRITIKFCTQCKWMLRAAYFAQELLSTFSTSLGEVSLQPSTGGVFTVEITYLTTSPSSSSSQPQITSHILWDRKTEGGFPEVKELKRRVRDCIDPARNLGHVDGNKAVPALTTLSITNPASQSSAPVAPTNDIVSPTSHGHTGEEEQAHLKENLEHQPGSRVHGFATPVFGAGEEVGGGMGERDDRKRNVDGSICEDCV